MTIIRPMVHYILVLISERVVVQLSSSNRVAHPLRSVYHIPTRSLPTTGLPSGLSLEQRQFSAVPLLASRLSASFCHCTMQSRPTLAVGADGNKAPARALKGTHNHFEQQSSVDIGSLSPVTVGLMPVTTHS